LGTAEAGGMEGCRRYKHSAPLEPGGDRGLPGSTNIRLRWSREEIEGLPGPTRENPRVSVVVLAGVNDEFISRVGADDAGEPVVFTDEVDDFRIR